MVQRIASVSIDLKGNYHPREFSIKTVETLSRVPDRESLPIFSNNYSESLQTILDVGIIEHQINNENLCYARDGFAIKPSLYGLHLPLC